MASPSISLASSRGREGAYYVPSGSHGTLMAKLICKVCPMVKLYIAQLEVLRGLDGRPSFTVESATEVRMQPLPRHLGGKSPLFLGRFT